MDIPNGAPLVYVSFSAEINTSTTESLIATMANLAKLNVKEVYLLFSTMGGVVTSGINLYNILKGMPFILSIHNAGSVNSIGNMVFLAGQKRYAAVSATFMFHGVGIDATQGQRLEEKFLKEKLSNILSDQKRIGQIISQNTKLTEEEIEALFSEAQTMDTKYALEKGIIHEIKEVKINPGCPIVPLVFKR